MARQPFGARLDDLAAEQPHGPAVTVGETTWTWTALARHTNRLARWMVGQGASAGELIAIALPNGLGLIGAVVAAWKVGATPMVLPEKMPATELSNAKGESSRYRPTGSS